MISHLMPFHNFNCRLFTLTDQILFGVEVVDVYITNIRRCKCVRKLIAADTVRSFADRLFWAGWFHVEVDRVLLAVALFASVMTAIIGEK